MQSHQNWSSCFGGFRLSRVRDRLPFTRLKDLGFNPRDKRRVLLIEELLRALKQVNPLILNYLLALYNK